MRLYEADGGVSFRCRTNTCGDFDSRRFGNAAAQRGGCSPGHHRTCRALDSGSVSYTHLPVLAWWLHGEVISANMLLGIILIVAGSLE